MISTAAAAAMAEAAPTSAWHPASAPATEAFRIRRYPTAPAVYRPFKISSSDRSYSSWRASRTPGTTPEEPAVGAATITPIEAFTSRTAIAYIMALDIRSPQTLLPFS